MTLLELATYVCRKVNQTEADDLVACKSFLLQRRNLIWADGLFKDSLFEYTQTLSSTGYAITSTWLPTKKTLLLPTQISHVLAVRSDSRKFNVQASERFYRMDFDAFASTGTAADFRLLPAAVWEFDTAQATYLYRANAGDVGATVTTDSLDSDGVTMNRGASVLADQGMALDTILRLDKMSKAAGAGEISLGNTLANAITNNGTTVTIFILSVDGVGWTTILPNLSVGDSVFITPDAYIIAIDQVARPAVAIPGGAGFVGNITYNGAGAFTFTPLTKIVTLAAADTVAPRRQRIQLIGSVPEGAIVRVLGKVKPPTFTDDYDEPGLTGIENSLMALAQGDMLERERQYAKAGQKFQEGTALIEQLKAEQTLQQATNRQIIPEYGYGDDDPRGTVRGFGFGWD